MSPRSLSDPPPRARVSMWGGALEGCVLSLGWRKLSRMGERVEKGGVVGQSNLHPTDLEVGVACPGGGL